ERKRREAAQRAPAGPPPSVSGAGVASPGIGSGTDPGAAAAAARGSSASSSGGAAGGASDRPEILIGAAFAGAFIVARVLKRLVD
ncbi:MAG TPA: hypothetical protein VFN44_22780, partial [Solirubrobacteraceae bacterium]|nr:hypothetical protein [Solirubrobacteraceae bacterium]